MYQALKNQFSRSPFMKALAWAFLFNIVYSLAIALMAVFYGQSLAQAVSRWDALWYERIIRSGYDSLPLLYDPPGAFHKLLLRQFYDDFSPPSDPPGGQPYSYGQGSWAFFPFYPICARLLGWVTGLNAAWAGFLVNFFAWPLLIALCYRHLRQLAIKIPLIWFVAFLSFMPFITIWYHAQYTEGLYGIFLILLLLFLERGQLFAALMTAFFLSLSRPTGLIIGCLAILSYWFAQLRKEGRFFSVASFRISLPYMAMITASGAGLGVFILYLYHLTGDGLAFKHVQIAWGHGLVDPFTNLERQFHRSRKGHLHLRWALKSSLIALVFVGCMFAAYRRNPAWRMNFLVVGATLVVAFLAGMTSTERYVFSNPLSLEFLAFYMCRVHGKKRFALLGLFCLLSLYGNYLWFGESHKLM